MIYAFITSLIVKYVLLPRTSENMHLPYKIYKIFLIASLIASLHFFNKILYCLDCLSVNSVDIFFGRLSRIYLIYSGASFGEYSWCLPQSTSVNFNDIFSDVEFSAYIFGDLSWIFSNLFLVKFIEFSHKFYGYLSAKFSKSSLVSVDEVSWIWSGLPWSFEKRFGESLGEFSLMSSYAPRWIFPTFSRAFLNDFCPDISSGVPW